LLKVGARRHEASVPAVSERVALGQQKALGALAREERIGDPRLGYSQYLGGNTADRSRKRSVRQ